MFKEYSFQILYNPHKLASVLFGVGTEFVNHCTSKTIVSIRNAFISINKLTESSNKNYLTENGLSTRIR